MAEIDRIKDVLNYNPNTGEFTWKVKHWCRYPGDKAGNFSEGKYVKITVLGKRYYAHRLAWVFMTGRWPKACIDHINGKKSDNRFANLREATKAENGANMSSRTTGKYKGVRFKKGRYDAYIGNGGKYRYLGRYDTPEEASAAYEKAAVQTWGEFARTT